jgi:Zn-dependent M28 family amino/carboxypeptidase
LSTGFRQAADHVAGTLADWGFAVSRPSITVGSGSSSNVVADLPGTGEGPRGVVLVTAHLDSINLAGGPSAPAPGADDNGSGSAGVLEMARVLCGRSWRHDLRVILFGGEEEGLHGSRQYVAALPAAERARIRAVLNLDMVGRLNTAAPTVLLEGAPRSAAMINDLATAAATATTLVVETSLNPFASDHVPFLDAGIPAVLTIEGADSANQDIHSDRDVLATVTPALAMQILRMDVAALVGWLEPGVTVPRPSGSVVSWGPGRIDVFGIG